MIRLQLEGENKMKKWITIFIGAAVVIAGFLYYQNTQAQQQASTEYQTEAVSRGTLTAIVGATGTVRSSQSAWLTWDTSGSVAQVNAFLGMEAQSGEVLASLEQTSLSQSVILAQADLVSAQQALDELYNTDLQQAQALQAVEDAQTALEELNDPEVKIAEALLILVNAQEALSEAESDRLSLDHARADDLTIEEAETDYLIAKEDYKEALKAFNEIAHKAQTNPERVLALQNLVAAEDKMDIALATYNWLLLPATEGDIAQADADLALAQANLGAAQSEYDRLIGGPTASEFALAEAKLTDAQKNYEDILDGPNADEIAVAEARIAATQATLAQIAIVAPFDGEVTAVKALTGDQVSAGTQAIRLDDLSPLLVDVEISEVDINQVQAGQSVELTFDAIVGGEYQGTVIEVSPVGEVNQGVVTFIVTVELLNADEQVKPGMTSAVSIITSTLENVLVVPSRAIRTVNDELAVYIMKNGVPTPVIITLGASADSLSEVLTGEVGEGDLLVLNPPSTTSFGPENGDGGGGGLLFGGGG
jgi:HlyD family secretion protein